MRLSHNQIEAALMALRDNKVGAIVSWSRNEVDSSRVNVRTWQYDLDLTWDEAGILVMGLYAGIHHGRTLIEGHIEDAFGLFNRQLRPRLPRSSFMPVKESLENVVSDS